MPYNMYAFVDLINRINKLLIETPSNEQMFTYFTSVLHSLSFQVVLKILHNVVLRVSVFFLLNLFAVEWLIVYLAVSSENHLSTQGQR